MRVHFLQLSFHLSTCVVEVHDASLKVFKFHIRNILDNRLVGRVLVNITDGNIIFQ